MLPTQRARTRRRILLASLLLGLAIVGHVIFWYLPRERAAEPQDDSMVWQVANDARWDWSLWVPYPHQNLAQLETRVGDLEALLAAAARSVDSEPVALPRFGPFRIPPARELALAASEDGDRFAAAADVYPVLAVLARLAGRLADNPWLAGGEVESGGRRAEVEWVKGVWTLRSLGARLRNESPAGTATNATSDAEEYRGLALAWLNLGRPRAPLPIGGYRLSRNRGAIELRTAGSAPIDWDNVLTLGRASAVFVRSPAGRQGAGAIALFGSGGPDGLPSAASLTPLGGEAMKLPGQGVSRFLSRLKRGEAAGLSIVALDRRSLAEAEALAPALDELFDAFDSSATRDAEASGSTALWVRPAAAAQLLADTQTAIDLLAPRRARQWRDWRLLLEALEPFEVVSIKATNRSRLVELGRASGAVIRFGADPDPERGH